MDVLETELLVIGGGPGGYPAAFFAADRGKRVILVEREPRLGGVCLNRGCIPSKALLHAALSMELAKQARMWGVEFGEPTLNLEQLRSWKAQIIERLASGLAQLARRRGVQVIHGTGSFQDSNTALVHTGTGQILIRFKHAVIATGSRPSLPKVFDLGIPGIMTSDEGLEIPEIPGRLLVVGGGYIGMELGSLYAMFGSEVTIVEALPRILAQTDPDLVRPVIQAAERRKIKIHVNAQVAALLPSGSQIKAKIDRQGEWWEETFDAVLVSIGRRPVIEELALDNTCVKLNEHGFIRVDDTMLTDDAHISAVGDVTGGMMLAHKATHNALVAVARWLGEKVKRHPTVPSVVFTDPEIAWCGIMETDARQQGIPVEVVRFPWAASGRAHTLNRTEGFTKLIIDPKSEKILGVGIVGYGAAELIGEAVLAIEIGARVSELASSVHPHPTLSETLMECAQLYLGSAIHVYDPHRRLPADQQRSSQHQ